MNTTQRNHLARHLRECVVLAVTKMSQFSPGFTAIIAGGEKLNPPVAPLGMRAKGRG